MTSIDPASISPADAAVALRSYPRRWRGAFAVVEDEEQGDELLRRGSPSALELLGRSRARLDEARGWLTRIRTASDPELTSSPAGSATATLDEFEAASTALASDVEGLPTDDWTRPGRLDGAPVSALDVVRRAVVGVSDDLRQAERTLREVVGRPG